MKISSIRIKKIYCDIFFDNYESINIHKDVIINLNLFVDKSIDSVELEKIKKEDEYLRIKNSAFRILTRRANSEAELIKKLKRKEYSLPAINRVVSELRNKGYINDFNFAVRYSEMRLKKYGWNRIKNELFRKGISKEILPKIESAINIKTEEDYLIEIASKKLTSIIKKENDKYKIKQKLYGFLVRKGFDFEDSKNVVDRITKEYLDRL
jgi:regulatory protein